MSRLARVVVPGLPHHVTQRGNGRQRTFFSDADYAHYRDLLVTSCTAAGVECWAYVLMPNHVHLILVPGDEDGLRRALAPVHRQYAGLVNARRRRSGHFWQGRFGTVVLDEDHLVEAFRYVLLNPVRARLVKRPEQWRWSSARAYLKGAADSLTSKSAMFSRFPDIASLLGEPPDDDMMKRLRQAETVGRPAGDGAFVKRLEKRLRRPLAAGKRGPKPKAE
jgi:putative transposase